MQVHCEKKVFSAKTLIIAIAPWNVCDLINGFDRPSFANSYMYHVEGKLRTPFSARKYNLFSPHHPVITITTESDGSHLFYTRHPFDDFKKYFEKFRIIKEHPWVPSIRLSSEKVYDEKIRENIYQASSFNLDGLEDAYINGLFCARKINEYLNVQCSTSKIQE